MILWRIHLTVEHVIVTTGPVRMEKQAKKVLRFPTGDPGNEVGLVERER